MTDLDYLKLPKFKKFLYKLLSFFKAIPRWFLNLFKRIGRFFKKFGLKIKDDVVDVFNTFRYGDWKTRMSFLILGFGSLARGQILRGILFLIFQLVFIVYMIFGGAHWLSMLGTLGTVGPHREWVDVGGIDVEKTVYGDNSFKILLYGILTIIFIIALLYTWRLNVKQNRIAEEILKSGKPLKSGKDDIHSLVDDQFHKTLLALKSYENGCEI